MTKYFSKEKNRTVEYLGPEYAEDGTNIPMSKGYRKILTVEKEGQTKDITDDLLDKAIEKGYKIKELADAQKANKLNENRDEEVKESKKAEVQISWKQFKNLK